MQQWPHHPHHACLKISTLVENSRTLHLQIHLSHVQRLPYSKAYLYTLPNSPLFSSLALLDQLNVSSCHAIRSPLTQRPRPPFQLHCPWLWNSLPPYIRLLWPADTFSPSEANIALSKQTFHSHLKNTSSASFTICCRIFQTCQGSCISS